MPKTVSVFVNNAPWSFNTPVIVTSDGISYKTVKVVYAPAIPGEDIKLSASAPCALNKTSGVLDANSAFEFILGPDVRRGNVEIIIKVPSYPTKTLEVSFQ